MVKIGDRIELIGTDDPYTSLQRGDKGTVVFRNFVEALGEEQIGVKWDCGSSLMLIYPRDRFKVIEDKPKEKCPNCGGEMTDLEHDWVCTHCGTSFKV